MDINNTDRQTCPNCQFAIPMHYQYPAHQQDLCVDHNVWRFQRCSNCGWAGDVVTGELLLFGRETIYFPHVGRTEPVSLRQYFEELDLCV